MKEEFVQDCRLTMAVDGKHNFTALKKGGGIGPMSLEEIGRSMDIALARTDAIHDLIKTAAKET